MQIDEGRGHETINFGFQEIKTRWHEAEDRFGCLAEASFSSHVDWVAFLVFQWFDDARIISCRHWKLQLSRMQVTSAVSQCQQL